MVNTDEPVEEQHHRTDLLNYLDELTAKYGELPSLLATRADYVEDPAESERLLLRAFEAATRIVDTLNLREIALSLADLYTTLRPRRVAARVWLDRARAYRPTTKEAWPICGASRSVWMIRNVEKRGSASLRLVIRDYGASIRVWRKGDDANTSHPFVTFANANAFVVSKKRNSSASLRPVIGLPGYSRSRCPRCSGSKKQQIKLITEQMAIYHAIADDVPYSLSSTVAIKGAGPPAVIEAS